MKKKNKVDQYCGLFDRDYMYAWWDLDETKTLTCCKCHKSKPYKNGEDDGSTCLFSSGQKDDFFDQMNWDEVCWLCCDCTKVCNIKKKKYDALKFRPGYKDKIVLICSDGNEEPGIFQGWNDQQWHSFMFGHPRRFKKWRYLHDLRDPMKLGKNETNTGTDSKTGEIPTETVPDSSC